MADLKALSIALRVDVAGYLRGMQQGAGATKALGNAADEMGRKVQAAQLRAAAAQERLTPLQQSGKASAGQLASAEAGLIVAEQRLAAAQSAGTTSLAERHAAYDKVGKGAMIAGAAMAAGLVLATRASMGFEKELSNLRAASGATREEMDALRAAALQTGKDTVFSASQAAEAETALAKAGVSVADILGGALTGAVSLAAAGQLDLGRAAELSAGAMAQFGLKGKDVGHIADLLAAGAGKAQGSVDDMGAALSQAGLVAAGTGLTIEETTAALAAFANNSLLGSDAGTSLKTMLMGLNPQSDEAAGLMDELGLRAYDAQGEFVGLSEYAGKLQAALSGMSAEQRNAALQTLFGRDAIRAAKVLYEEGAAGVAKWESAVNDAGYAEEYAATATDNLSGDIEGLGGSIETALIQSGSTANDTLRALVKTADSAVGIFTDLPGPIQAAAVGLAAAGAATGVLGGAALVAIPRLAAMEANLVALGISAPAAARGMAALRATMAGGAIAAGIVGIVAGVDQLRNALADSGPGIKALERDILHLAATGELSRSLAGIGDDVESLVDRLDMASESTWLSFDWGTSATEIQSARNEIGKLDGAIASLITAGGEGADAATNLFESLRQEAVLRGLGDEFDAQFSLVGEALAGVEAKGELAAGGIDKAAGATDRLTQSAKEAVTALEAQAAALRAQYDPVFAMEQAIQAQITARADAAEALKKHGRGSKEAQQAQIDLLSSTVDLSGAAATLAASVESGATSVAAMKTQLAGWVAQGLISKTEADALATKLGAITARANELSTTPAEVKVKTAQADVAKVKVDGLHASIAAVDHAEAAPVIDPKTDTATLELYGVGTKLDHLGRTVAVPRVQAATGAAQANLTAVQRLMLGLDGRVATVTTVYRSIGAPGAAPVRRVVGVGGGVTEGHADGGPIIGAGSGTSDSLLRRLSNGEHVWTAHEVRAAGGHSAVEEMRRSVRGYAAGGAVGSVVTPAAAVGGGFSDRQVDRLVAALASTGGDITINPRTASSAQEIATDLGWELAKRRLR